MRKILLFTVLMLLAVAFIATADDQPWFDMEKCAFCAAITAQPGLMDHMKFEYHNLHNGTMSVTHIDSDFQPAFEKAQQGMQLVVKDLQSGKEVYMCNHCRTLGELMMSGVTPDQIRSGDNIISIYTSSDTTMIRRIQDFGAKSAQGIAVFTAKAK